MKIQSKLWIIGYLILVVGTLTVVGFKVVKVDPFFHYHKPDTDGYYYVLNNQRSQNDGIIKHFDYNALITGTSMTENFKTSEMDNVFGTKSIKVSYSGGTYKEINDSLKIALANNPDLKTIVRGLDMEKFMENKNAMRQDLGEYPTYLYDNLLYNDVKYVFNRDVIFQRVYPMVRANDDENFKPGITPFDAYANWMASYTFGVKSVCPEGVILPKKEEKTKLTKKERKRVLGTVRQNITSLAKENPDVTFYYFITPYSIAWWGEQVDNGAIYKVIEAEEILIKEILKQENIKLFSFNNLTDITTDLNNYKDKTHYGSWVNSLMLRYMKDGKCLLTYDNYKDYLKDELSFYITYDYSQISTQPDYESDYYAEAILNSEINGVEPLNLLSVYGDNAELKKAKIVEEQHNGQAGIKCKGTLQRESGDATSVANYVIAKDYIGAKFILKDISQYKFLGFYGMKNKDEGQPSVYIYDQNNKLLSEFTLNYQNIDDQWHQYIMDISQWRGPVTIVFHGGYIDDTGSQASSYTFSDIFLY